MSDWITLSLRAAASERLEIDGVTADRCAPLSEAGIAALRVWSGSQAARVGDFFTVRGGRSPCLRIEGDLAAVDGIGAGNADGEIVVEGGAGGRAGAGMTGGRVEVRGSVGDDAGVAMAGGVLRVHGHAGERLGANTPGASKGMTGGEVVVTGSAGAGAASRMRRGLVAIGGNTGGEAGRAMIAGTLVVLGSVAAHAGRGSKRGSIVAAGPIEVPPTYRYACTFEPTYVRFLMTYLSRQHGLPIEPRIAGGRYRRYCGDAGGTGRGEILILE